MIVIEKFKGVNPAVVDQIKTWRGQKKTIDFVCMSEGIKGREWPDIFKSRGMPLGPWTRANLKSPEFNVTPAGVATTVRMFRGTAFTKGDDCAYLESAIRYAKSKHCVETKADIACYLAMKAGELGNWGFETLVIMSNCLPDDTGDECLLQVFVGERTQPKLGSLKLKNLTTGLRRILDPKTTGFVFAARG